MNSSRGAGVPLISSINACTAAVPMACTDWRKVVSGGSVKAMSIESSYPMTETSPGTFRPRCRTVRTTPRAMRSEPHTIAVQPAASR